MEDSGGGGPGRSRPALTSAVLPIRVPGGRMANAGGRASHLLFSRSRYSAAPAAVAVVLEAGDDREPAIAADRFGHVYAFWNHYGFDPGCPGECPEPHMSPGSPRTAGARGHTRGRSCPAQPPSSTTSIVVDPEFLKDEGCIETSPMERIRRPRLLPAEERDVVTVSDDEVARMFSACEDWQELSSSPYSPISGQA